MAVSVFAVGALSAAGGPFLNVPLPAGSLTGKVLVVVANTPAGTALAELTGPPWTSIISEVGDGIERLDVLWRHVDGTEENPSVFTADDMGGFGRMFALDGCLAAGDVIAALGAVGRATSSATVTAPSLAPADDDAGVLFIAIAQNDVVRTCSGYSGTNPTFSEVADSAGVSGDQFIIAAAFGVQDTAGATGDRTATLSGASNENQGVMIAFLPAAEAEASDAAGGYGGYRKMQPLER